MTLLLALLLDALLGEPRALWDRWPHPAVLMGRAVSWADRRFNDRTRPAGVLALAILLAGFVVTTVVETRASRAGLMPAGYIGLRWVLTSGAVLCLGCVLLARLVGAEIVI